MERGSGSEGRRRGGGQHMKCADRQMEELAEDKQTPCSHLVRHLRQAQSGALNLTTKESAVIVQSILGSMVKALCRGEKIEIRGFGSFHTRQRGPRTGRNPKNGLRVAVPAKTIPYFIPSKEVRALINNSAVSSKEPALA